jgi:hypothetical protein
MAMSLVDNIIHLFAPLTANCSDFQRRWDAANARGPEGISGCWEGEWLSAVSGHRGRLRCVVQAATPERWRMSFRGEYAAIFRACYSTDFAARIDGDRWTFNGGSDLGRLAGGAYECTGHATLETMQCTYRSSRDHGTFRLARYTR